MKEEFNWNQPVIIVGILLERNGKFLFVKEAGGPDKGKWNLPAGKLDLGETIVAGAIRETLEETGYKCKINGLLGIYRSTNNLTRYIFVFRAEIEGEVNKMADDISDKRWFTKEEIMAMDNDTLRSPRWKEAIVDFEEGQNFSVEIIREIK